MTVSTFDIAAEGVHWSDEGPHHPVAIFARTPQAVAVRAALGLIAAVGSLVLPWLGLNLRPSLTAWDLTFSLGAVPLLHHLSYGLVISVLTVGACASLIRSRGRTTTVTRAVGWAYLALSVTFLVTTRAAGAATMFALQNDANQSQIINSQFLTNANSPPPTQFLGIGFDAKSLILLYAVRLGWYVLPVAGILLAGRLSRPSGRLQWVAAVGSGLAAVTVAVGLVLGFLAQSAMDDGIQSVASGRAAVGQQQLASALRLDPGLAYDSQLQQAVGMAQADQGHVSGLADYAEALRPVGLNLTLLQQGQLFGEALASLPPGSPAADVVQADVVSFLATATISAKNPDVLTLVSGELGQPAVSFSVGRYYYEAGDNPRAITTLERTATETGNSEVTSLSLTYIALAWLRLGNEGRFRQNIVAAVKADVLNENVYARELAAGLYVPGTP